MDLTREKILRDRLEMARHNLYCYSANHLCTAAKEGKEKEYEEALAEVRTLDIWLMELRAASTENNQASDDYTENEEIRIGHAEDAITILDEVIEDMELEFCHSKTGWYLNCLEAVRDAIERGIV